MHDSIYAYFAYSYGVSTKYVEPIKSNIIFGKSQINATFESDNIFATQFHREKSGVLGLNMIKNFIDFEL